QHVGADAGSAAAHLGPADHAAVLRRGCVGQRPFVPPRNVVPRLAIGTSTATSAAGLGLRRLLDRDLAGSPALEPQRDVAAASSLHAAPVVSRGIPAGDRVDAIARTVLGAPSVG